MPEYPGVYVEELPGVVSSLSSSQAGFTSLAPVLHWAGFSRPFPSRSNPIWQTDWKYVNIRREVLYIEQSLAQQLQWVVFEPNGPALWTRVKQSIGGFLTKQWLSGSLQGTKQDEAYFVKCDGTTMTQNDLDNGRLVILVGIAPVAPAEFVIFRIGAWTAAASPHRHRLP